jgi:hypothetical protein
MTANRRHYAFARHALVTAFGVVGARSGSRVLVPDFICRDLLASFAFADVRPVFYAIDDDLQVKRGDTLPSADAMIVVNYFGFAADLTRVTSMLPRPMPIIEDNAHGWLSADADGAPLGSRTAAGITSVRKTIRVPDGAYVECRDNANLESCGVHPELSPRDEPLALGYRVRRAVATIDARSRLPLMAGSRSAIRLVRTLSGRTAVHEDPRDERVLPEHRAIHRESLAMMARVDRPAEVRRRRELFAKCSAAAVELGINSPTPRLSRFTSPQGFPYFGDAGDQAAFVRRVYRERLGEIITWPSLPTHTTLPLHSRLRTLRLVNFLA